MREREVGQDAGSRKRIVCWGVVGHTGPLQEESVGKTCVHIISIGSLRLGLVAYVKDRVDYVLCQA